MEENVILQTRIKLRREEAQHIINRFIPEQFTQPMDVKMESPSDGLLGKDYSKIPVSMWLLIFPMTANPVFIASVYRNNRNSNYKLPISPKETIRK